MLVVCSTNSLYIWGGLQLLYIQIQTAMGCRLGCSLQKKSETLKSPTSPVRLLIAICDSGHPRINEEPTPARLVDTHQFY